MPPFSMPVTAIIPWWAYVKQPISAEHAKRLRAFLETLQTFSLCTSLRSIWNGLKQHCILTAHAPF